MKDKLIVILGPTAAGKTALSIKLAKKFNGEIVSADSRQVYKGMDLGTGKVTKEEMQGIRHHLLDVASPKRQFSVAQYQKKAVEVINKILKTKKIPFLVGGSPFYIYAVTQGWQFPKIKPNKRLRKELEKKDALSLIKLLEKLDPERAGEIDKKNKRRLIRAIEIAKAIGKVPRLKNKPMFNCLYIGINMPKAKLKEKIRKRLEKRLKKGMIQEVKTLRQQGISWKKLESFGLEYKWVSIFLQKKISREEMKKRLQKDIENFAKRQMTWFKKDKRINWIKNQKEAEKLIKNFL